MCIIFVHNTTDPKSKYKLVIAANRDEFLDRPAKPADFHPKYPHVLCGVDMEKGVEGGTWLGVTKTGKFAALTNFLVELVDETKLPRGHIVMNYLKDDVEPLEYLKTLQNENYRAFNILAGRPKADGKIEIGHYSTKDSSGPRLLDQETNVLACTHINGNWRKIKHGRTIFSELLSSNNDEQPDKFADQLFTTLLSDTACLHPDEEILKMHSKLLTEEVVKKYSSIKIVDVPGYGTRMQTVVLLDKDGIIHFYENSLLATSDNSKDAQWTKNSYTFAVEK